MAGKRGGLMSNSDDPQMRLENTDFPIKLDWFQKNCCLTDGKGNVGSECEVRVEKDARVAMRQDGSFVVAGVLTMFPGNLVSSVIRHLAQLCPVSPTSHNLTSAVTRPTVPVADTANMQIK